MRSGSRVKMGAGLATANNIIQKHKGQIKVETRVGKSNRDFEKSKLT